MKVVALALIVASIWGITPIFEKLSLVKASPLTVITLRFIFTTTCVIVFSLVTGRYREIASVDGITLLWIFLAGLLGGVIGLSIYFFVLKQDLTSRIVPIAATFPLFTALYAFIFLHETLSIQRLVGIVLIVIGLIFVNWNNIPIPGK
jgi:bacterial/archaeal transporter family protein